MSRIGETNITQDVFEQFLAEISPNYTPEKYKLLEHNCNNFTNEACEFLTGKSIPSCLNLYRFIFCKKE